MEANGRLTLEGCIEMAWVAGYLKHFERRLKDGTLHVGWVDTKPKMSQDPIRLASVD